MTANEVGDWIKIVSAIVGITIFLVSIKASLGRVQREVADLNKTIKGYLYDHIIPMGKKITALEAITEKHEKDIEDIKTVNAGVTESNKRRSN